MAIDRIEKWREIHRAASELFSLAPWEYLEENEIFGIRTSLTGRTYFISVMGSLGQVLAVSAYEGSSALMGFWELHEGQADPGKVLAIPHMMLSFDDKKYVDKTQKEIIKESGLFSAGHKKWPVVTRVIPGLFPKIPEGDYLDDMAEILPQIIDVCKRAENDIDLILPDVNDDETYLIREKTKSKGKAVWRDSYEKVVPEPEIYNITIPHEDIESLRFLRRNQSVYQADYRMIPATVKEKGQPEYFPFTVLLTEKKSGYIAGFETIPPLPDYRTMVENIPQIIVSLIKKLKFRPMVIEVKDHALYEMLKPAMGRCAINIVLSPSLASIDEAFESLSQSMKRK